VTQPDPGAALLEAVAAALPDLEALAAHAAVLGPEPTAALVATTAEARARLAREELHVVVVGEQKSGKSTFLNALMGERVLGAAVRECTATITRLRHGAEPEYVARFTDGHVERFSEQHPTRDAELASATDALAKVRDQLALAKAPLPELPASHALEPLLPAGLQDALVDAYRNLTSARADRDASEERLPKPGTGPLKRALNFFPIQRARAALERAELRLSEAEHGVLQAQQYMVERRIGALAQAGPALAQVRRERFAAEVTALTDQAGRGREVEELELWYPGTHLPPGLVLIDTPGVNTQQEALRERAWRVIREEADGCWLLSDIQQALSASTREFLQQLRPYVAHVLLVLTKVDKALANAEGVGGDDPREQVEEARKLAVRRFAKELDRAPREVFAVATAAERALDGQDPAAFQEAVETLLALARQERAIVLGARAAGATRRAIKGIEQAGETARQAYEARIEVLEAQRIPQPAEFLAGQLELVKPRLAAGLRPLLADAVLEAKKKLARQQTVWMFELHKALDEEGLKAEILRLAEAEPKFVAEAYDAALEALRVGGAGVVAELEPAAFEELKRRYHVIQEMAGSPSQALVPLGTPDAPEVQAVGQGLEEVLVGFHADRLQLGVGGAAAGAALGSLVMPGVGTLVGALVGSLAAFFVSLDDLKQDCTKQLEARMGAAETRLVEALGEALAGLEATLLKTLEAGLAAALRTYQAWIEELLANERAAIAGLQDRLADLAVRREALQGHEATLAKLMAEAEAASRGLARSPDEATASASVRLDLSRPRRRTGGLS
jgi:GTP-binding protein EngB required for normal cell division